MLPATKEKRFKFEEEDAEGHGEEQLLDESALVNVRGEEVEALGTAASGNDEFELCAQFLAANNDNKEEKTNPEETAHENIVKPVFHSV